MVLKFMVEIRQSSEYSKYMQLIGWRVEKIDKINVFIKKLPLIGSVIKIQRPDWLFSLEKIENFARQNQAIMVKIEPDIFVGASRGSSETESEQMFKSNNWQRDNWPLLPTKTLKIGISQSLDKIKNDFDKDCRYCLRKAEKNRLSVKISCDRDAACRVSTLNIDDFSHLWEQNARQSGFWIPIKKNIKALWEAFGENAYIVSIVGRDALSERLNQKETPRLGVSTLASVLIIVFDKTAHYYHAASTPLGRKLNAPYLLVWESLKLAQKLNCKIFDFEGIYDKRYPKLQKGWKGFTHFKKSFGGEELTFSPPQIKFYNPLAKFFLSN